MSGVNIAHRGVASSSSTKQRKGWFSAFRKQKNPNAAKAKVFKGHPEDIVGITFRQSFKSQCIFISHIAPDGLFADSDLRPGQRVLTINKKECPASIKDAIQIIRKARRTVRIEAEKNPAAPTTSSSTTATTTTTATKAMNVQGAFPTPQESKRPSWQSKLFVSASSALKSNSVRSANMEYGPEDHPATGSHGNSVSSPTGTVSMTNSSFSSSATPKKPTILRASSFEKPAGLSGSNANPHQTIIPGSPGSAFERRQQRHELVQRKVVSFRDKSSKKAMEYSIQTDKPAAGSSDNDNDASPLKRQASPNPMSPPWLSKNTKATSMKSLGHKSTRQPHSSKKSNGNKKARDKAAAPIIASCKSYSKAKQQSRHSQELTDALKLARRISKIDDYEKEEQDLMDKMKAAGTGTMDVSDSEDETSRNHHRRTYKTSNRSGDDKLRSFQNKFKKIEDAYANIMATSDDDEEPEFQVKFDKPRERFHKVHTLSSMTNKRQPQIQIVFEPAAIDYSKLSTETLFQKAMQLAKSLSEDSTTQADSEEESIDFDPIRPEDDSMFVESGSVSSFSA